jgi:hypothetical protein
VIGPNHGEVSPGIEVQSDEAINRSVLRPNRVPFPLGHADSCRFVPTHAHQIHS